MAAGDSMTFVINDASTGGGNPQVQVTITENADGTVTFNVTQLGGVGAYLGDLRGFFFDIADESLIGSLTTSSSGPITELQQGNDTVKDLGNGANMQGLLGDSGGYDVGVEFGTAGIGTGGDDVRNASFTLDSSARNLTLDDFANVTFGVRITSVGQDIDGNGTIDTARTGSSKIGETTFTPIDVANDAPACVEENTPTTDASANGNIFANDGANPVLDVLTVTGWSDSDHGNLTVGTAHAIVDDSGANEGDTAAGATVKLNANGTWTIDASTADALSAGEEIQETFTVNVKQDHYTDGAHLNLDGTFTTTETFTVEVCGVNDGPVAQDDDFTAPDQCILEDGTKSGNVKADNGNGADSDVDRLDTISVTAIKDALGNLVALDDATSGASDGDDTAIVTLASGAKVTIHSDGSFTYDTNAAFTALTDDDHVTDSFVYQLSDNNGATDEATATVCIDGVGTVPPPGGGGEEISGLGLSHGYWKEHQEDWGTSQSPVATTVSFESIFGDHGSWDIVAPFDTDGAPYTKGAVEADIDLMKAFELGGGGQNELAREAVAAYLNAIDEGNEDNGGTEYDFAYTVDEVKALVADAFDNSGGLSMSDVTALLKASHEV
jgi:Bacterial cadherin-like domain